jgi:phage recombination protein Bet
VTASKELARINPPQPTWNDEDKALIRQTVAKGATDSEFKLLLYTAAKYDLDPLVKQIWCVKYGDKPAAIYTSRDGFLHLAHKSGQFDGMETVAIHNAKGELTGAKCSVWRKGYGRPFVVEVALKEYNTNQNQWSKMPETMIKKVAESQCLRRAFDISGLYEPGEIDDGVVETTARPVEQPAAEPVELRPEISDRLDRADSIKTETGIDTITDSFGSWARLTQAECEAGAKALIAAADLPTAAKMLGVASLSEAVKAAYPDATGKQQFAAALHLIYEGREKARAKADQASGKFEDAVVTEIPPADGEADQDF